MLHIASRARGRGTGATIRGVTTSLRTDRWCRTTTEGTPERGRDLAGVSDLSGTALSRV